MRPQTHPTTQSLAFNSLPVTVLPKMLSGLCKMYLTSHWECLNPNRPSELRLRTKKPSPSPTRRQSQPALPPGYAGSPVRIRRGSNPPTPTSAVPPTLTMSGRPVSVYDPATLAGMDPGRPPIPVNGPMSPPPR
jgi:hypothetical protein